jgi:hypothetical protein
MCSDAMPDNNHSVHKTSNSLILHTPDGSSCPSCLIKAESHLTFLRSKHGVVGLFADARETLAPEARLIPGRPIDVRYQLAGNPSRGSEHMFTSEDITWRIETTKNLSGQVAAVMCLAGDGPRGRTEPEISKSQRQTLNSYEAVLGNTITRLPRMGPLTMEFSSQPTI